ncbi:methyl-accepting chemotaxis protein [Roseibium denhamense]|uniref:Methyl-accepting chemotaxis protein n=1 Tax=Roseibium denhamense TaxID=76305 RepID=A0ABY1NEB0_9HYPH|nr:HAMP domain-containing methyl-accepting chemotaxis protein [Roseibium denhamense]MTI04045.1 methyl-accepting chemotaxis protein [Roseibium denhamense]SMP07603.1 Methyl-accepting chemotaxis protein [Roseibium denhamense]
MKLPQLSFGKNKRIATDTAPAEKVSRSLFNWPIKTQLRAGFAIMLLCTAGVGASGLFAAMTVQKSATTAKAANELLGAIPQLQLNVLNFRQSGSADDAAAVRADIATLAAKTDALSAYQPEAASDLDAAVSELEGGFETLAGLRRTRDAAVSELDKLTLALVASSNRAFEEYQALKAYRAALTLTNEGKMSKLAKVPPRISAMQIATIAIEKDTEAFAAAPDEARADALIKNVKQLGKDAKAVRRSVKTDAIKNDVKMLGRKIKDLQKLIKAHLKEWTPAAAGAWPDTFQPAISEITALSSRIAANAEAPIEALTAELRDFDRATARIAVLSGDTQSIARTILGIRSAYADYLNSPADGTAGSFNTYMAEATAQLEELEQVRVEEAATTSDAAFQDVLNGPLKDLTDAGTQALPVLAARFDEVVAATQARAAGQSAFSAAAAGMAAKTGTISRQANQTAVDLGTTAQTQIIIALGIALALGLAIVAGLTTAITRPLRALTGAMLELKAGITDIHLNADRRGDELGDMARAVGTFRDREVDRVQLEAASREREDSIRARQETVDGLVSAFRQDIQTALNTVNGHMKQLDETAEQLTEIASSTTTKSQNVSQASSQTNGNVQTIAAATEELSASVQEVGRQVGATLTRVEQVTGATRTSNDQIQGLSAAADQIGAVVQLIQDIAEQTNLLALNATIEAARAGDAGKGFAVVASEVKSLAGQTAKATDEISSQVAAIQQSTAAAVDAINGILTMVEEVNETAAAMAASVDQQSGATSEISAGVSQAAEQTASVSSTIDDLSRGSSETSQSAQRVEAIADEATTELQSLTHRIDRFLEDVAAA